MNIEEAIKELKRLQYMAIGPDEYWLNDDEIQAIETVLKELEHQIEKRNNQRQELAILNEKQKEFKKLTNTVNSYKGMYKKQQKEIKYKDKIIDLIAEMINNHDIDEDICSQMGKDKYCNDYTKKENCIKCIKEYFREKVSDNK